MIQFKFTDCLVKLKENDTLCNITDIQTIKTVKNRKAAFQIIFMSEEDAVLRTDGSLYYRQKCGCPAYRLEIDCGYKTYVYPESFMKDDDGVGKADILLGDTFCELEAGKVKAVWVDVDIPGDAESGEITVKVFRSAMFSDEEVCGNGTLNLETVGYTLPDAADFSFYLDLWQHCSNIARVHEVGLFSEKHFEIIEKYVETLAYLGQKAVTVVASEIPWSGQSCYRSETKANLYEYSMIKIVKKANGRFSYDFSAMRRYIKICFNHGIDKEISVYGLANIWKGMPEYGFTKPADDYPDDIRVRYYDEKSGIYRFMSKASEVDNYIKAIYKYFIKEKLIDKVRIAADEPGDITAYRQSIDRLMKNAPLFKYKAAINHAEFVNSFGNVISDFVPFIGCLCSEYDEIKTHLNDAGKRFLWYVCCGPVYPNTFIRSELYESLLIAAFTSYMKLDGFLRWNYTVFPDDPRTDIKYNFFPAGDVNFVYPSRNGEPLLTVRYKAMRYAAELFEMLKDASAKASESEMDELYGMIIKEKDTAKYFTPEGMIPKDKMMSCLYNEYNNFYDKIYTLLMR